MPIAGRRTPGSLGVKPKRRNKKSHRANDAGKQNRELAAMRFSILKDPDTEEWIGFIKEVEACRHTYRWDVQNEFGI